MWALRRTLICRATMATADAYQKAAALSRALRTMNHLRVVFRSIPNEALGGKLREKLRSIDCTEDDLKEYEMLYNLVRCLHDLQVADAPVVPVAMRAVKQIMPSLNGHQIARLLSVCSAIGNKNDLAEVAGPIISETARAMAATELAHIAQAFAKANIRSRESWEIVASESVRKINDFSSAEVVSLCQSIGIIQLQNERLAEVLERRVTENMGEFTAEELATVVKAFKSIGVPATRLVSELSVRPATNGESDESEIASVLTAINDTSGDDTVAASYLVRCRQIAQSASMKEVVSIVRQCCADNVHNKEVYKVLVSRVEELKETWSPYLAAAFLMAYGQVPNKEGISTALARELLSAVLQGDALKEMSANERITLADVALEHDPDHELLREVLTTLVTAEVLSELESPSLLRLLHICIRANTAEIQQSVLDAVNESIPKFHTNEAVEFAIGVAEIPRAKPVVEKLCRQIAEIPNWTATLRGSDMYRLVMAVSKLRIRNTKLLDQFISYATKGHRLFLQSEKCGILVALAQLGLRPATFFELFGRRVLSWKRCPPSLVCHTLYAFALANLRGNKVALECMPRIRMTIGQLEPRDICHVLFSIAQLRIDSPDLAVLLAKRATALASDFKYLEVVSALSSLRALDHADDETLVALSRRMLEDDLGDVQLLLSGLIALLKLCPSHVTAAHIEKLLDLVQKAGISSLSASAVTSMLLLLAKRSSQFPLSRAQMATVPALVERAKQLANTLNAAAIVDVLWSIKNLQSALLPTDSNDPLILQVLKNVPQIARDGRLKAQLREAGLSKLLFEGGSEPIPQKGKVKIEPLMPTGLRMLRHRQ